MITASLPSLLLAPELGAPPSAAAAHTAWVGGRVNFENACYLVSVGDDSGSVGVWVLNKSTQEQYLAGTPPRLQVGDEPALAFVGTTSLALHDGTLLTLSTDTLAAALRKLTVTQGDYGVEILGLGGADDGGLRFVETHRYGHLLDAAVGDGNLIHENELGSGFIGNNLPGDDDSVAWVPVDQAYLDATDIALLGELAGNRGAARVSLSTLLAVTFAGVFRGPMAYRYSDWVDAPFKPGDPTGDDGPARRWRLRVPREGAAEFHVQAAARPGS